MNTSWCWRNRHHWVYWKLLKWQIPVQVMTKMSSKFRYKWWRKCRRNINSISVMLQRTWYTLLSETYIAEMYNFCETSSRKPKPKQLDTPSVIFIKKGPIQKERFHYLRSPRVDPVFPLWGRMLDLWPKVHRPTKVATTQNLSYGPVTSSFFVRYPGSLQYLVM